MKTYLTLCCTFLFLFFSCNQQTKPNDISSEHLILNRYFNDENLSSQLENIITEVGINEYYYCGEEDGWEKISFAVIYEKDNKPFIGGVNMDNFIYPASVYKMYIAAEVLHQIEQDQYDLNDTYVVKAPNDVDWLKEISFDPRPLLRHNDTVTINYLLDLMITRSDNSAANCLIDLAGRPAINTMIHSFGWEGSEVTRKFLSQKLEDPAYLTIRGTETSALHTADFMYLIANNQLISPWVSRQMKLLLGRQLDGTKLSAGLPKSALFYHKTGWWSHWTNDVGFVLDGENEYVIALLMPIEEEKALPIFKEISQRVHQLILKTLEK